MYGHRVKVLYITDVLQQDRPRALVRGLMNSAAQRQSYDRNGESMHTLIKLLLHSTYAVLYSNGHMTLHDELRESTPVYDLRV